LDGGIIAMSIEDDYIKSFKNELSFLGIGFASLMKRKPLSNIRGTVCILGLVNSFNHEFEEHGSEVVAINISFNDARRFGNFNTPDINNAIRLSTEAFKKAKNPKRKSLRIGKIPDSIFVIEKRRK